MDNEPTVYVVTGTPAKVTLNPREPDSRYKTRQLQIQVVGTSKMIRTFLTNVQDVAKDMQIPAPYLGAWIGYNTGSQSKFDKTKPERQQSFVSGEHLAPDLSVIVARFVEEVLLCPNCGLPEIIIAPSKNGKTVCGQCRACPEESELPISEDKFVRYVINHPPNSIGGFDGAREGKQKKPVNIVDEAIKSGNIPDADQSGKEVVWFSDTSKEAMKDRRDQLMNKDFVRDQRLVKIIQDSTPANLVANLKAGQLGVSNEAFVGSLFNATFTEDSALTLKEWKQHCKSFKAFCSSPASQTALLNAIENFVGLVNKAIVPKVAGIVKYCYDLDIVDEEVILEWFDNPGVLSIPAVRKKLEPFITWLKEADEESDSE